MARRDARVATARVTTGVPGDSIEELVQRETAPMRRLAYLVTGSIDQAEEIVQDAFTILHQRWATVEQPGGYLRTVVVRHAVAARRRHTAERAAVARVAGALAGASTPTEPEVDVMWQALSTLSPRRRAALVLRFYGDLSTDDIAATLGCTAATVRSLIHRGIEQLRTGMDTWTTS